MKFNKWTLMLATAGVISLESASSANRSFFTLFERLEKDIEYDSHQTVTAFHRSNTQKELVKIGPRIFPVLAEHLRQRFPNMKTSKMNRAAVDWDMFGVWVWLICAIRKEHKLPQTPYAGIAFKHQDIRLWYDYCLANS